MYREIKHVDGTAQEYVDKCHTILMSKEDHGALPADHQFQQQSGDGVPNVLSDDDTFVNENSQTPLSKVKIAFWMNNLNDLESAMTTKELRNFHRNQKMIDLDKMPENIYDEIIQNYENQPKKTNMKILNYLVTRRCNPIVDLSQIFYCLANKNA